MACFHLTRRESGRTCRATLVIPVTSAAEHLDQVRERDRYRSAMSLSQSIPTIMENPVCSVVSPHLLDALAASDDPETRELALKTLALNRDVRARRKQHFDAKATAHLRLSQFPILQGIIANDFLEQAVRSDATDGPSCGLSRQNLVLKKSFRDAPPASRNMIKSASKLKLTRKVYDMENIVFKQGGVDVTCLSLPGKLVRSEGEAPIADQMANEAYENCAKVLDFYHQVFGYTFLGDGDAPIISSVHYQVGYQNAQWIGGNVRQMVYGDGGPNLHGFTGCLDIIGHEMTVSYSSCSKQSWVVVEAESSQHAVTEQLCHLTYKSESGALNEHISDVFGKMISLWNDNKTSAESDWLIGERCLMPDIPGVALRNMKHPGTAYDDPRVSESGKVAPKKSDPAYHKVASGLNRG
jgi:hypothetical protein